jgi:serine protease inhibitor
MINARNTNFVLTAANAIWYKKGFQVEPAFIERNENYFGAEVVALNFSEPASVGIINAWTSEKTQGKIDRIVSAPLDPAIRLLLANAVYFHGNWEYQFDTNYTTNRTFDLPGGAQESIPMMEQTASFSYCATNGYQAVRLPYKGSNLAMYVFPPGPDSSLGELLGTMSGQWWQQTISGGFTDQTGTIILPRFNLNYSANLNEPLQALGMVGAFSPDADFSRISRDPLSVSEVKQQAIVEVNEEGTVAAAVTTVTVIDSTVPEGPPPFLMIVNRPFVFFIEDQQAGTILFMGAVFEP